MEKQLKEMATFNTKKKKKDDAGGGLQDDGSNIIIIIGTYAILYSFTSIVLFHSPAYAVRS